MIWRKARSFAKFCRGSTPLGRTFCVRLPATTVLVADGRAIIAAEQEVTRPFEDKPVKLLRKRLDSAGVQTHLETLAGQAEAIEVRIKGAAAAYSESTEAQLQEAARQLRAGEIAAVQVRYIRDGAWWSDTVMRAPKDYRLVRMQELDPESTEPAE